MKRNRLIIAIAAFAVLAGTAFAYRGALRDAYGRWQRGPIPVAVSREEAQQTAANANANVAPEPEPIKEYPATKPEVIEPEPEPTPTPTAAPTTQPLNYNLSVPFIPQAPHKVWDPTHEDACEEAAMVTLQAYMNDEFSLSMDEIDRRLLEIIDYETKTFGEVPSIDAARVVAVMRDYLKLDARAMPVTSIDDIKREIAAGHPVLLLAAGKLLQNPNFKNGGPLYHALVAKGYTATKIITNDPGTRLGADYTYDNDVLFDAIHEWNDGDVYNGAKTMIIIGKK